MKKSCYSIYSIKLNFNLNFYFLNFVDNIMVY